MAVAIQDLSFSYDNRTVLDQLSFHLYPGEVGTLIGASGSGKSTLFKILTGLVPQQAGRITVFGRPLPEGCQNIAYMMQQDMLLPWRTVLSNVLLVSEVGLKPNHDAQTIEEAHYLLEEVGLKDFIHRYPGELSGGMRQRVSLARALLQKRPLLLLDEPFGALDVGLREQMYRLLIDLKNKHGYTILMVTHDFRDALSLSDRLFLLSKGAITKEWNIHYSLQYDFPQMNALQREIHDLLVV